MANDRNHGGPEFCEVPHRLCRIQRPEPQRQRETDLFVTYANQSTGGGIVDEFSTNGTFIKTLIYDPKGFHLDAPWGLAIAPAGWGQFGGDLLVANNNPNSAGLTEINAYNLKTGAFAGTLMLNHTSAFFRNRTLGHKLRQRCRRRFDGHALFHRRAG